MRNPTLLAAPAAAALLALAACSPAPSQPVEPTPVPAPAPSPSTAPATPSTATPAAPAPAGVIGLEGLGDLKLGQPVPVGGAWAERGAQASDGCSTITSPDYPGVYAIVENGKVQRVTVGERSSVKLVEGVGVGSTEKEVRSWFGGFREEPHKYIEAPAKYLTAPNAASGDPAVRFEIGADGKVALIHVGMMPTLGYVEGCS